MNASRQIQTLAPGALRASALRSTVNIGVVAPAMMRLISTQTSARISRPSFTSQQQPLLRSTFLPYSFRLDAPSCATPRSFHVSASSRQQQAEEKDPKAKAEENKEPESEPKQEKEKEKKDGEDEGEGQSEGKQKEKQEDMPPPPPHGDKTPWQVFLDTMQTEFKQSKEWNESTKALASSAHQFAESEKVRKAREAYEATTGVVGSAASTVVKTTAGAIGKGAQWTWETPVMKGVRKGANITGEALDKATKPIRETEAYKNVKNVIDDGSSSRYGGWIDKEERRKRREELAKQNPKVEVFEEDPE